VASVRETDRSGSCYEVEKGFKTRSARFATDLLHVSMLEMAIIAVHYESIYIVDRTLVQFTWSIIVGVALNMGEILLLVRWHIFKYQIALSALPSSSTHRC